MIQANSLPLHIRYYGDVFVLLIRFSSGCYGWQTEIEFDQSGDRRQRITTSVNTLDVAASTGTDSVVVDNVIPHAREIEVRDYMSWLQKVDLMTSEQKLAF